MLNLVVFRARLQALGPLTRALLSPSRAEFDVGLGRAQGSGWRLFRPEAGPQAEVRTWSPASQGLLLRFNEQIPLWIPTSDEISSRMPKSSTYESAKGNFCAAWFKNVNTKEEEEEDIYRGGPVEEHTGAVPTYISLNPCNLSKRSKNLANVICQVTTARMENTVQLEDESESETWWPIPHLPSEYIHIIGVDVEDTKNSYLQRRSTSNLHQPNNVQYSATSVVSVNAGAVLIHIFVENSRGWHQSLQRRQEQRARGARRREMPLIVAEDDEQEFAPICSSSGSIVTPIRSQGGSEASHASKSSLKHVTSWGLEYAVNKNKLELTVLEADKKKPSNSFNSGFEQCPSFRACGGKWSCLKKEIGGLDRGSVESLREHPALRRIHIIISFVSPVGSVGGSLDPRFDEEDSADINFESHFPELEPWVPASESLLPRTRKLPTGPLIPTPGLSHIVGLQTMTTYLLEKESPLATRVDWALEIAEGPLDLSFGERVPGAIWADTHFRNILVTEDLHVVLADFRPQRLPLLHDNSSSRPRQILREAIHLRRHIRLWNHALSLVGDQFSWIKNLNPSVGEQVHAMNVHCDFKFDALDDRS
ncbi:hypothetical protein DFH09DRAFT_1416610 [Mycena vulgaris]|nr:hypothetical protein DFH09DRAFT_1416610 [Mycena vulgaris]